MANITYSAGIATAYGAAVRGGYTGTYEDFCRQQAQYAESAAAVEQAKEDAEAAANAAEGSKTAAAGSASAAATSAGQASTSATNAANSATAANASKNAAATSAGNAENSATAAAWSAGDAQTSADDAQASAEAAEQSAASVDVHTDGNYPEMTVGTSEQLISTQYVTEKTPYLYRTTGGGSDVGNREYVRGITGGTVAWNQLCNGLSATVPSGHKYLSKISTTWSVSASTGAAITGLTSGSDMVIDLTQLFGTTIADYIYSLEQANAGAGVAFFRKLFPNDYYPYNAGELKSVEGVSSHEMVGFNQWDEEWEVGTIDATGTPTPSSATIRSKNFISILPSTTYYYKGEKTAFIHFYDADENWISMVSKFNETFTTPSNARFVKFRLSSGTTYNHDICINLAWSGTHNGEYKPYEKHTYALDSSLTLRGIPKLDNGSLYYDGDVYGADGGVQRTCEEVTISVSNTYVRSGNPNCDFALFTVPHAWYVESGFPVLIGEKVVQNTRGWDTISTVGAVIAYDNGSRILAAAVPKGATLAEAKALFDGTKMVYRIATPTTEPAEPYTEVQICDGNGTEAFVSTSIVPVGHVTEYPENLRDKLQHLPDLASADGNYIVSQSGTQMTLAPLPIVIPAPPTTDGTYTFRATVSNGEPTLSWVEE